MSRKRRVLYHATRTENLPSIMNVGLRGEVYLFRKKEDAFRRVVVPIIEEEGDDVSILTIETSSQLFIDPLYRKIFGRLSAQQAFVSDVDIPPSNITRIENFTEEDLEYLEEL